MTYAVNKGFNKNEAVTAMFVFNSATVAELRSLTYSVGGSVLDVGAQDDLAVLSVVGRDDVEVTAELVGSTLLERGATGAIAVTWNDGVETEALTNAVITQVSTSGSMDSEITSSLTFKEAPT